MISLKEALVSKNRNVNIDREREILNFLRNNYTFYTGTYKNSVDVTNIIIDAYGTGDQYDVLKLNTKGIINIKSPNLIISLNKDAESLTDGLFEWGELKINMFRCTGCKNLKSLTGSPKKLIGDPKKHTGGFDCSHCDNLISLEGGPLKSTWFSCNSCPKLKTLEGAPEYVDIEFNCSYCDNLISLEGISQFKYSKISNDIVSVCNCIGCPKIKSLKGIPQIISKIFVTRKYIVDTADIPDYKIKWYN